MKLLMMRSLLLFAALGYFLAAFHTLQHHHAPHAALQAYDTSAPSHHSSGAADHDCPIFTAHSLAVATLPPPEFTAHHPLLRDTAPVLHTAALHLGTVPLLLSTRAPPIV
jgi:hypothetical protein